MNELQNESHLKVKKPRQTVENKKCLRYWIHEFTLINGCTIKPNPDKSEGKEWCKIEAKTGEKDWGFCFEELDFDQVRQGVKEFYQDDTSQLK